MTAQSERNDALASVLWDHIEMTNVKDGPISVTTRRSNQHQDCVTVSIRYLMRGKAVMFVYQNKKRGWKKIQDNTGWAEAGDLPRMFLRAVKEAAGRTE